MKVLRGRMVVGAAVLLCGLYLGYRTYENASEASAIRSETLKDAIYPVAIVHPEPLPATETVELPGTIVGWYEAPIYARAKGYVKMWYKDYGAHVKKGDVLAELNTPDLDADYRQAKADLEAARARYALAELTAQRYVAQRKMLAVSEQEITVRVQEAKVQEATVRAAEQKVKNVEAFIGFKKIVAPFDGVVTRRNVNVGDLVSEVGELNGSHKQSNLFTVAIIDKLRLFVSVPMNFGAFLKSGLTADVTVPQFPGRHFAAKFLTVSRGFDEGTRTAVTVFEIENEDHALWPGSYAHVRLTAASDRQGRGVSIPSTALVFVEHGTLAALVTEDNRVIFKPITVSRFLDHTVEIGGGGLSPSDRVINNPRAGFLEGDAVRIVTPAPGYAVEEAPGVLKETPSR